MTLPCIAELVFPEPAKWKKSWETVYRSLVPRRNSIIQDEERVRSVSERPAMRPPHGNPGSWTAQVLNKISREFKGSAGARMPTLLLPTTMIASMPKTAGGSFDHPLRFLATCKDLRHFAQLQLPCTTTTRFVPAVFVVSIMTFLFRKS